MTTGTVHLSRRQLLAAASVATAGAAGFGVATMWPRTHAATQAAEGDGTDGWASPLGSARGLAAHLLRRTGFSYTAGELDQAAALPYTQLVEQVLAQQPDSLPAVGDPTNHVDVVRSWYGHMATTGAQYPERMTLFWHGVLTSDFRKAARLPLVLQQNQLYRTLGRSDLRTLLLATTFDPLMMRYLDSAASSAAKPNENYSRELMELFTLGPGNYTETDVREGARIFSGIRARRGADGAYAGVLVPRLHDSGVKTYLGHTGNIGPEQAIDILLAQPACATHIAQRALVQFCTPAPSPALVNDVATQFRNARYDVTALMRAIVTSHDFAAASAYRSLVRQPADHMVATMRALGRPDLATACVRAGAGMGQALYDMPTVAGWPPNQAWISSSALLARINFAWHAIATHDRLPDSGAALQTLLDGVASDATRSALNAARSESQRWYALLASPEFQLK
ncbi:MAG: DUF1800 domain-containing protein [Candidatus Dormibacteraeota bacterium]|nr:DUF1800 domain-containing protein [Candidatus Dormibacteraeota bacterium]